MTDEVTHVAELIRPAKTPVRTPRSGTGLERRLVWLTVGELEHLIDLVKTHDAPDQLVESKLRKSLPPTHPDYLPKWGGSRDGDAA